MMFDVTNHVMDHGMAVVVMINNVMMEMVILGGSRDCHQRQGGKCRESEFGDHWNS
jgi:hypothetical protein